MIINAHLFLVVISVSLYIINNLCLTNKIVSSLFKKAFEIYIITYKYKSTHKKSLYMSDLRSTFCTYIFCHRIYHFVFDHKAMTQVSMANDYKSGVSGFMTDTSYFKKRPTNRLCEKFHCVVL